MEYLLAGNEHFDGYDLSVGYLESQWDIPGEQLRKTHTVDKRGTPDSALSSMLQIIDIWSNDFILNFELWGILKSACGHTIGWKGSWKTWACVLLKTRTHKTGPNRVAEVLFFFY